LTKEIPIASVIRDIPITSPISQCSTPYNPGRTIFRVGSTEKTKTMHRLNQIIKYLRLDRGFVIPPNLTFPPPFWANNLGNNLRNYGEKDADYEQKEKDYEQKERNYER
jgi:hypothetical protein